MVPANGDLEISTAVFTFENRNAVDKNDPLPISRIFYFEQVLYFYFAISQRHLLQYRL